jgi:hypothetical protein
MQGVNMRKFVLSITAVLMLVAPAAAGASDPGTLTTREARSAARAYVATQTEALEQFHGLKVVATRVGEEIDRVGPRRMIVHVALGLHWDDGRNFVCMNRVRVTKRGRSIRARGGNFDC